MFLSIGAAARADDLHRPSWWDFSRKDNTYQLWEFYDNSESPMPDYGKNDYGFQAAAISANRSLDPAYLPTFSGASGGWDLEAGGLIRIPVSDDPNAHTLKKLYIQMTWLPAYSGRAPLLSATAPDGCIVSSAVERTASREPMPNGWVYSIFDMTITPCPSTQTLFVRGDIYLDEIVFDTYSTTPEPTAAALLLLGLPALWRRRKRCRRASVRENP
jgi:MYXO-CTERM domain-containing protein